MCYKVKEQELQRMRVQLLLIVDDGRLDVAHHSRLSVVRVELLVVAVSALGSSPLFLVSLVLAVVVGAAVVAGAAIVA